MDTALVLFLILLNGLFAMSEMALTASRKARLQVMVESGEGGAQAAMDLHDNPTKFLSTVQIGITGIGVLNGIVGDAAFSGPLSLWLTETFHLNPEATQIAATALVVVIITLLTIVFGELVPKRIGQIYPETVARLVAPPMNMISTATRPLVKLLSFTTEATLGLLGLRNKGQRGVTEEEIAASLEEGLDAGVIEEHEHQMVRNVFRLDERQIGSMMIPRAEIAWLDADATPAAVLAVLREHGFSRYPVCRGSLSEVLGVANASALLAGMLEGQPLDLTAGLEAPLFVPETLSGMELLEHFRVSDAPLVFVVDEYGEVQGVIAVRDVLEAIAGEFNAPSDGDAWAVQREDGSWLIDGLIPVPELKDRLELKELPEEDRGRYNTLAGMIMLLLGRLPRTTDVVEWDAWRFEVVDLDGKRVDKVLVSRLAEEHRERNMSNPPMYGELLPLDREVHKNLKLDTAQAVVSRVADQNSVFLAAVEFADACKEYPIVFVRAGQGGPDGKSAVAPLAVLGLRAGSNLFVETDKWTGSYVPAYVRRYPFAMARLDESANNMAVCYDTKWPAFNETIGEALFKDGQPSEFLLNAKSFLENFEQEAERTRLICNLLVEMDLLQEMRFEASLPNGEKIDVEGFLALDEKKYAELPDDKVLQLHRNGLIALIEMHRLSLGNMNRLASKYVA